MTTEPLTLAHIRDSDDAWADALAGFSKHLCTRPRPLTPSTLDSYLRDIAHLRDGVTGGPWTLTTRAVSSWLNGRHWSRRTRLRVLVSLRAFYRYGITAGLCDRSPLVGLTTVTLKKSGPQRRQPTPLWSEHVEDFQRHLAAGGRSPATIDHYGRRLLFLSEAFADPWAVTTDDLADYLSRPDWTPNTKRMYRATIQRFYAWARRSGRTTHDPAADLDPVRIPRKLPRPAPDDALTDALSTADDRARLAIELAALAGLRRSEIARLRWDQITAAEVLVQGKGGHWRRVPLHPDLCVSLNAARHRADRAAEALDRVPSPFVFPSSHGGHLTPAHLGKIISRHIPPGTFTPHALRHRFATQAYAATLDLRAVQELLGHTKPETTAIYAAVPDGALTAAVMGARLGMPRTPSTPDGWR